jgi:hypothetical protein
VQPEPGTASTIVLVLPRAGGGRAVIVGDAELAAFLDRACSSEPKRLVHLDPARLGHSSVQDQTWDQTWCELESPGMVVVIW